MNIPFLPDDPKEPMAPDEVDVASAGSMDASDPPAFGGATGTGAPDVADDARIERIRARAYELWQAAGCPADADRKFWFQAEAEIGTAAEGKGPSA